MIAPVYPPKETTYNLELSLAEYKLIRRVRTLCQSCILFVEVNRGEPQTLRVVEAKKENLTLA